MAVTFELGRNDEYKDCGMAWLLLNTLEHLQKENDKLGSLNFQLPFMNRELLWQP